MEVERNGEYKFPANQTNLVSPVKQNRTDNIGIWKILCTYMIVILHYGNANGWKLAVEFFFIVSGLLLAYEYDMRNTSYLGYIKKRILRLWPHYIFSFAVFITISAIWSGGGQKCFLLIEELRYSILEIFMLQILGIGEYASNHGAVWYVSALVVSSLFLYGFLWRIGANQRRRILLCVICIIVGYCSQFIFGDMCIVTYEASIGFCLIPGLIRGISEMAIGVECYYSGKWLKGRGVFEKHRKILVIIEVLVMMAVTVYTRRNLDRHVFIILAYTWVAMIAFFVEHTARFSFFFNRFEKYTYAIYLNHPIILIICAGEALWKVLIIVTGYSIITTKIIEKIEKILVKGENI